MTVLMASSPTPTTVVDPSTVGPGALAFWIIFALLAVGALLWFSMRRHLRRVELPRAEKQQRGQIPLAPETEQTKPRSGPRRKGTPPTS